MAKSGNTNKATNNSSSKNTTKSTGRYKPMTPKISVTSSRRRYESGGKA